MIKILFAVAVTAGLLMGCADETENERPGEPATYERIESLSDCVELQSEFDTFMAVVNAQEPDTERRDVALAYAEATEARMQEIDC